MGDEKMAGVSLTEARADCFPPNTKLFLISMSFSKVALAREMEHSESQIGICVLEDSF